MRHTDSGAQRVGVTPEFAQNDLDQSVIGVSCFPRLSLMK